MLKKTLPAILLLMVFASKYACATAFVSGTMKNAYLNDRVELRVPTYYLNGRSLASVALIDESQQFSLSAEIQEPQIVFLIHNEDQLPVFLEPNDTLFIETDMFQFPLVTTFSGRAAHNNRLLKQFLQENPQDFNEFNNLRYKIGYWWTTVESNMDRYMDELETAQFKELMDNRKSNAFALLDDYSTKANGKVTPAFQNFLAAEIIYDWAYHLLLYGNVYKNKHQVGAEFFEFLYDAPTANDMVGSEAYRRFIMTFMAWKNSVLQHSEGIYTEQYLSAPDYLGDKSLAFFRSEIIMLALKSEKYGEILPFYTSFLKGNKYAVFDEKITDLYEKAIKVSPGVVAPDFSGRDLFGEEISLHKFHGKTVYLNFWASWCGSCIKKMNFLDDFATDFQKAGVVVINVSLDEDQADWNNSIGENQFMGYQILASAPVASGGKNIARIFNVEAVPQYFIIDKSGVFAEKGYSHQPDDIRKRLLELK